MIKSINRLKGSEVVSIPLGMLTVLTGFSDIEKASFLQEIRLLEKTQEIPDEPESSKLEDIKAWLGLSEVPERALTIFSKILLAKPGSILLLEHPDAYLHPRLQTRLGELLLAQASAWGVQIIVETNSDALFNGVRLSAAQRGETGLVRFIHLTGNGNGNFVTPRLLKDARMDSWPEDFFFSEMDIALEKLCSIDREPDNDN